MALGHRVTVEALARTGAQERNLARCRALLTAGVFNFFVGRYAEARDHDEESLAIAREIRDRDCAAEALVQLGYAILALGSRAKARAHMQEALAVSRTLATRTCSPKRSAGLRRSTARRGNSTRQSRCTRKPWQ